MIPKNRIDEFPDQDFVREQGFIYGCQMASGTWVLCKGSLVDAIANMERVARESPLPPPAVAPQPQIPPKIAA